MKIIRFIRITFILFFLFFIFIFNLPMQIYYLKKEVMNSWELLDDIYEREVEFKESSQELVFTYHKKQIVLPNQTIYLSTPSPALLDSPSYSSYYGEVLKNISGIILFASKNI